MNFSRQLVVTLVGILAPAPITWGYGVAPVLTFPTNYKSGVLYNSVDRDDRKEIHLQYTSRAAIEAAEAGKPLPDGAVITSVAYAAALDSKGNPLRDAKGNMVTGSLLRFVVMEKRAGSGAAIPQDLRNGDWQFAAFTADGKHDTDPQAEVKGCMACHKPHDQLDYVKTYLAMSGKRVETNPTPVPMGAIVATVVRLAVTPTRLKVRVGTPVTWINTDDMPHQFIVEGAALKTGYLVKGQAGTVIPNKPGVYSYRDTFLPTVDSLKGLLVVTD